MIAPIPARVASRRLALCVIALLASLAVPSLPADAATSKVAIVGMRYQPSPITIAVGDTVTWTNQSYIAHTVTAVGGVFDSKSMSNGASFSFTFPTAGTYRYICTFHRDMKGEVIVGESTPSGPAPIEPPVESAPTDVMVHMSRVHGAHRHILVSTSAARAGERVLLQLYSREHFTWLQVAHGSLNRDGELTLGLRATLHRRLRVVVVGSIGQPALISKVLKT